MRIFLRAPAPSPEAHINPTGAFRRTHVAPPRLRLPTEVLHRVAMYADRDACLALLQTGWTGYAAALPHLYSDVLLSDALGAGLEVEERAAVAEEVADDGHAELMAEMEAAEEDDEEEEGESVAGPSLQNISGNNNGGSHSDSAHLNPDVINNSTFLATPSSTATPWPNAESRARKVTALSYVRRLRVRRCPENPSRLVSLFTRLRAVSFEAGADVMEFFERTGGMWYGTGSRPSVCMRMSCADAAWSARIGIFDGCLAPITNNTQSSPPTAALGTSAKPTPPPTITLHGFDLRSSWLFLPQAMTARLRFWPSPTRSLWTETPWADNVADWETFLHGLPRGETDGSARAYELVVPHEPLTCGHTEEYADAAFFLRVLLRMEMVEMDVRASMPYTVECACGEGKEEQWCSDALRTAMREEGLGEEYGQLVERMSERDARRPSPANGPCRDHIWDVKDMAAAAQQANPDQYAAARAAVVRAWIAEAGAVV